MPSASRNLYARFHVRRPTSINFLLPRDKFQDQDFFADGYLVDAVTGAPVPSKIVIISYTHGLWDTDTTDVNGYFTAAEASLSTLMTYTFQANFTGDADYLASSSGVVSLTIWKNKYKVVTEVEDEAWGAILCIDPHSIRTTSPVGPIFLLMDSLVAKPGLTDKNGSFIATLIDNLNEDHWDMYLLRDGTEYIRDTDEFWVGVQRESYHANNDPENDVWNPSGGSDGKGAGRKWEMGGYITKRFYAYGKDTQITAVVRGKCYMDVLYTNHFGTPQIPRSYTSPTDFSIIADDVLEDLNITSGLTFTEHPTYWPGNGGAPASVGVEWTKDFKTHSDFKMFRTACEEGGWEWRIDHLKQILLFERSTGPSTGKYIEYDGNIRNLPEIMMGDSTELITHIIVTDGEGLSLPQDPDRLSMVPGDWLDTQTPGRVFSAISYPAPPNHMEGNFSDNTLIQDQEGNPALCFMKNDGLNFDLHLNFGYDAGGSAQFAALGADVRKWRRLKFNFRHATRMPDQATIQIIDYTGLSGVRVTIRINNTTTELIEGTHWTAAVSNTATAISLATAIQGVIGASTTTATAFVTVTSEDGYHLNTLSTDGPAPDISISGIDKTLYQIYVMTADGLGYTYGFGKGEGFSHQISQGYAEDDDVSSRDWHKINLMIPQATDYGVVVAGNPTGEPGDTYLKGWSRVGGNSSSVINYVRIWVQLSNSEQYAPSPVTGLLFPWGPGRQIITSPAGDFYINISAPEVYAGYPAGTMPHQRPFWPEVECIVTDGVNTEALVLAGVHGTTYPTGTNVRLLTPMPTGYGAGDDVHVKTGYTICFSRFHFARNMSFTEARSPQVYGPPYRYKLMSSKDMETLSEAESYAQESLEQEATPRQWVRANLDGDPEKEVGYRITVRLDPAHNAVFQNVSMTIDDITYVVDGPELRMILWLGKSSVRAKPREINEFTTLETIDEKAGRQSKTPDILERVR